MADLKPLASHEPSLDELLADAKRVLAQAPVAGNREDFQKAATAEVGAQHRTSPLGQLQTYGKIAKDSAVGASLPAAFLGGPAGMAAGGVLAADALNRAVEDPSMWHAAEAGVSMLPFAGPARRLMHAGREAKAVSGIRNTFGAGDMGATVGRETPYRMGGSVQSAEPMAASGPETVLQRARQQVQKFFANRLTHDSRSSRDILDNPESLASMDRMGRETRYGQEMSPFGPRAIDEARAVGQRFGGTTVEVNPAPSFSERLTTAQSSGRGPDAQQEIAAYIKKLGFAMPGEGPVASHVPRPVVAAEPPVTRVPMHATGDEFAGVQPYGPETALTPEEAAAEGEFWDLLMKSFGTR